MEDLHNVGGTPAVLKMLIAEGLIDGSIPTITGRTLAENVAGWPSSPWASTLSVLLPIPSKSSGHLRIMRGNLAPGGAVAKITGKEGEEFYRPRPHL